MGTAMLDSPNTATNRVLKLVTTLLLLLAIEAGTIVLLLVAGAELAQPLSVRRISLYKPWILGVLGGLLGGSVRAGYDFMLDMYAFEFKRQTAQSSPLVMRLLARGPEEMEDKFDPLCVWNLYLIRPLLGAGLGFLFALLLEFGLVPFLTASSGRTAFGIIFVAGLGGIFADETMRRFRDILEPK